MINGKTGAFPLDDDDGGREFKLESPKVWAKQMENEFVVDRNDGQEKGLPGDYLVQNKTGEAWVCKRSSFELLYEEVK